MRFIAFVCAALSVVIGSIAITYDVTKNKFEPKCATSWNEAKAEDDFCVTYFRDGRVFIGPLSDLRHEDHVVGS